MSDICSAAAVLVVDIKAIHQFLAAQAALVDVGPVQAAQCRMICDRIQVLPHMSLIDGTELTSVFSAGPWTCSQKADLAAAVQHRMSSAIESHTAKVRRKNQTCTTFQNYLTESDIQTIKDPNVCTLSCILLWFVFFLKATFGEMIMLCLNCHRSIMFFCVPTLCLHKVYNRRFM